MSVRLPRRITQGWLERRGASPDQVALFAAWRPQGTELTSPNVVAAHALGIDIAWLIVHLPLLLRDKVSYWKATAPALAVWKDAQGGAAAVRDSAHAAYQRAAANWLIDYLDRQEVQP